ncbi:MAG: hypothetical protein MJ252_22940 [archaeon]|nr:hypothetical protein [archaeon]
MSSFFTKSKQKSKRSKSSLASVFGGKNKDKLFEFYEEGVLTENEKKKKELMAKIKNEKQYVNEINKVIYSKRRPDLRNKTEGAEGAVEKKAQNQGKIKSVHQKKILERKKRQKDLRKKMNKSTFNYNFLSMGKYGDGFSFYKLYNLFDKAGGIENVVKAQIDYELKAKGVNLNSLETKLKDYVEEQVRDLEADNKLKAANEEVDILNSIYDFNGKDLAEEDKERGEEKDLTSHFSDKHSQETHHKLKLLNEQKDFLKNLERKYKIYTATKEDTAKYTLDLSKKIKSGKVYQEGVSTSDKNALENLMLKGEQNREQNPLDLALNK